MSKKKTQKKFKASFQWGSFDWKKQSLPLLLLFVIPLLIYIQSIGHGFVLDDILVLSENNFVTSGIKGIGDIFTNDAFTGYFGEQKDLLPGSRYRPLSMVMFAVEHEFFGLDPRGYHVVNVLLYALLGLLMYRVALLYLPKYKSPHVLLSLAFLSTLLYVVHPIHTECVANIKGRDEILAMLFSLGTLYALGGYLHSKRRWWLVLLSVLFLAGLLSKENTLTFLGVVPLAMYFFTESRRPQYMEVLSTLGITTLVYLGIRYAAVGYILDPGTTSNNVMNNPFLGMSIAQKYATIVYTLGDYLRLLVFPLRLTHDYYPYQVPISSWGDFPVLISLGLYGFLIYWGVRSLLRRKRVIGFSILFFGVTLSIASNIFISVGTFMNERFLFMPSWGFVIGFSYILLFGLSPNDAQLKNRIRWAGRTLLLLYILALGIRSSLRVPVWESALTLNTAAVKVSTNSARANLFMGTALYNEALQTSDSESKEKILLEAETYIDRSLQIFPSYPDGLKMKLGVATELNKIDRDTEKMLASFLEVASVRPQTAYLHEYLTYMNDRGRFDAALTDFYVELSFYHLLKDLDPDKRRWALKFLNYALEVAPQDARVYFALSQLYSSAQNSSMADQYMRQALAIDPNIANRFR